MENAIYRLYCTILTINVFIKKIVLKHVCSLMKEGACFFCVTIVGSKLLKAGEGSHKQ